MKTNALYVFAILAVLLIAYSCASTSKATDDKSTAAKEFKKHPSKGIVYLYRPGRFVGAAASSQIKINGTDAGGTGPGTFFRWELTPGTYAFSAFTTESSTVIEVDVEANQHYFIRQDERLGLSSGRITMVLQDEAKGMKGVESCKLLVSAYRQ
jgi:hypothetical protein